MSRRLYGFSRVCLRAVLTVFFRLRVRGQENVPRTGPCLLAANHASFLDPPLAGVGLRRPFHFFARSSLAKIPILGWWFRGVGALFVDRDAPTRQALQQAIDALQAGRGVVVFPEGTRSATGAIGSFKRGLLLMVRQSQCPVVPVGIRGTFAALPRHRRFPRLFRRCEVTYGTALTAEAILAEGGLAELRQRVAELSGCILAEQVDGSR